ncbi:hypothetical protein GCM10009799_09310 [Nocardiopsis rhodophaea]|uniref:DUF5129 domain-containing protein n=1 Tax=Nocardiopsis rhodophaea TaxID=280238 RepID=A0ABN2SGE6_9ACTN
MSTMAGTWRRGSAAIAGTCGVLLLGASPAAAAETEHARTVYCLGADQRPDLIEAATALGHAERVESAPEWVTLPADTVPKTVHEWRAADRDGFTSACHALIKAYGPKHLMPKPPKKSEGGWPSLSGVIGALRSVPEWLAGALTGFVISAVGSRSAARLEERKARLEELGTAVEFQREMNIYLRALEGGKGAAPSRDQVDERGLELKVILQRLHARHPDWPLIPDTIAAVTEGLRHQVPRGRKTTREQIDAGYAFANWIGKRVALIEASIQRPLLRRFTAWRWTKTRDQTEGEAEPKAQQTSTGQD